MDFSTIASIMWPYWTLGLGMIFAVRNTEYKDLIRIEKKSVVKWSLFLVALTLYRTVMYKIFPQSIGHAAQAIKELPWQVSLTVFWEDCAHGLPLLLLMKMLGTKWFTIPIHVLAMLLVMFSFGLGHTYQGVYTAILLSFYIPATVHIANRRGFGTVMICHSLYDLSTILFLKMIAG